MSTLTAEPGQPVPELGLPGERRRRPRPTPEQALAWSHLPGLISVGVWWLFFVAYWVPELGRLPGASFVLTQLSPLAARGLTSQGEPLVALQSSRSGLVPAYLLVAALAIPVLARARFWLVRLALIPVCYLAGIGAAVTLLGIGVRDQWAPTFLGSVLLVVWVVAALITAWRSLWVEVPALPARPRRMVWWLVVYAIVSPAPVAVGRRLFAPELREAALTVSGSGVSLRWSALLTPASIPLYLAGLAVGVLVTVAYVCVPPRWPGVRTSRALGVALLAAVVLLWSGSAGSAAGQRRAAELATASPAEDLAFRCAAWLDSDPGQPVRSVIVGGPACNRVSSYAGYRLTGSSRLPGSARPVTATMPDKRPITSSPVATRYGAIIVLAVTSRLDTRADRLVGIRMDDAVQVWAFRCPDRRPLTVRFAGGDDPPGPAAGRVGLAWEGDTVVVGCSDGERGLDPASGRRLTR